MWRVARLSVSQLGWFTSCGGVFRCCCFFSFVFFSFCFVLVVEMTAHCYESHPINKIIGALYVSACLVT